MNCCRGTAIGVILDLCMSHGDDHQLVIVDRWTGVELVQECSLAQPLLEGGMRECLVEVSATRCCRLPPVDKVLEGFSLTLQHLEELGRGMAPLGSEDEPGRECVA